MSNQTINEAFSSVFGRIRAQRIFASTLGAQSADEIHGGVCIKAAISKCIDFNIIVNRERRDNNDAFLLLSGLRGIVEDLIFLKYILRFKPEVRAQYFNILQKLNLREGIFAQKQFFEANNPFQFVVGSRLSCDQANRDVEAVKKELQAFWKSQGCTKKNGPSVRYMAGTVRLKATYEYIYFAASNFVHFNPHALMRTGWGPEGGPFTFSIGNFGGYYRDLAAFYGAILYIGFAATFGFLFGDEQGFTDDLADIEEILLKTPRWPELVTFEELNLPAPPLPKRPILHAIRAGARAKGENFEFAKILNEVKGIAAAAPAVGAAASS